MDPKNSFAELKRRNVYRVAAGYAVVGWLVIQVALLPVSEDALDGLRILGRFAGVCARAGDTNRALEILEDVVAKPSGPHYGELMLDERWDPLRKEPRFEKLLLLLAPK